MASSRLFHLWQGKYYVCLQHLSEISRGLGNRRCEYCVNDANLGEEIPRRAPCLPPAEAVSTVCLQRSLLLWFGLPGLI